MRNRNDSHAPQIPVPKGYEDFGTEMSAILWLTYQLNLLERVPSSERKDALKVQLVERLSGFSGIESSVEEELARIPQLLAQVTQLKCEKSELEEEKAELYELYTSDKPKPNVIRRAWILGVVMGAILGLLISLLF